MVDIFGEFIGRPLILTIQCLEVERMDGVAVECGFVFLDHGVMTVNPHRPVIVRDRKGEDLPMKLLFALYSFVELDDTSHGNSHTVSVLSIGDVKRCSTALHFAREEREVHPVRYD